MCHHIGTGASEDEIAKLKKLGEEWIVRQQIEAEQNSAQGQIFEPDTVEERMAARLRHHTSCPTHTRGRKPKSALQDLPEHHLVDLGHLHEEGRIIEGIHDVAGHVYDQLGYSALLSRKQDQALLKDLVLMRLAEPSSKLRSQQLLQTKFGRMHDLDHVYRILDKLHPRIEALKTQTYHKTLALMPDTVDIVFFDCTTLYFESTETTEPGMPPTQNDAQDHVSGNTPSRTASQERDQGNVSDNTAPQTTPQDETHRNVSSEEAQGACQGSAKIPKDSHTQDAVGDNTTTHDAKDKHSQASSIRQFGYSKDHRFNTTQVVLALATNGDGLPIGYELFEGNKAEVKTLLTCVEQWQKAFTIGSVLFVADRAMMSKENMKLLEESGHRYIIAAKLRQLPQKLKEEIHQPYAYRPYENKGQLGWVGEFAYQGKRLIVSYKDGRAARDAYQRQNILDKIQKKLKQDNDTKSFVTNQGVKKYTKTEASTTSLDQNKIDNDTLWDGLHGVITNSDEKDLSKILGHYGRLWKIEESFRLNKHTLSMRPIYHFKSDRIRSHIALCYMAFAVLRHMEYTVRLTQKLSPQGIIDELMQVQSSLYTDVVTQKRYRLPSKFSHKASKIYRAFQLQRNQKAQMLA